MIIRAGAHADTGSVLSLLVPDPASRLTPDQYKARVQSRDYRPEWTWLAFDDANDHPVAVALWWGDPRGSLPGALDAVYVRESVSIPGRVSLVTSLLRAAHEAYARAGSEHPPPYHVFLAADWRSRPDAVAALSWREEAARLAGLTASLARLSYEWTAEAGLPELSGSLVFEPEPDDEVFADVVGRVMTGTLDATSSKGANSVGALEQARREVEFYRTGMFGDRHWWRIARTPDGQVAGFGIPSQNSESPVIGYLGVLPEHRGHGYAREILAEITRILVAEAGASLIEADTDLANRPMAAAFEQAGYRNSAFHLVLSAP
jgi:GNAT superfamily N-acetyltransferase